MAAIAVFPNLRAFVAFIAGSPLRVRVSSYFLERLSLSEPVQT